MWPLRSRIEIGRGSIFGGARRAFLYWLFSLCSGGKNSRTWYHLWSSLFFSNELPLRYTVFRFELFGGGWSEIFWFRFELKIVLRNVQIFNAIIWLLSYYSKVIIGEFYHIWYGVRWFKIKEFFQIIAILSYDY